MAIIVRNPRAWRPSMWEDMDLSNFFDRENLGLAADVYETDDAVTVKASVPGMKPNEISINVTGDTLSISGEHKEDMKDEKRNYFQRQLRYGLFAQSVTLPAAVSADEAEAKFEHGILTISLPKAQEAKPKQIKIKTV